MDVYDIDFVDEDEESDPQSSSESDQELPSTSVTKIKHDKNSHSKNTAADGKQKTVWQFVKSREIHGPLIRSSKNRQIVRRVQISLRQLLSDNKSLDLVHNIFIGFTSNDQFVLSVLPYPERDEDQPSSSNQFYGALLMWHRFTPNQLIACRKRDLPIVYPKAADCNEFNYLDDVVTTVYTCPVNQNALVLTFRSPTPNTEFAKCACQFAIFGKSMTLTHETQPQYFSSSFQTNTETSEHLDQTGTDDDHSQQTKSTALLITQSAQLLPPKFAGYLFNTGCSLRVHCFQFVKACVSDEQQSETDNDTNTNCAIHSSVCLYYNKTRVPLTNRIIRKSAKYFRCSDYKLPNTGLLWRVKDFELDAESLIEKFARNLYQTDSNGLNSRNERETLTFRGIRDYTVRVVHLYEDVPVIECLLIAVLEVDRERFQTSRVSSTNVGKPGCSHSVCASHNNDNINNGTMPECISEDRTITQTFHSLVIKVRLHYVNGLVLNQQLWTPNRFIVAGPKLSRRQFNLWWESCRDSIDDASFYDSLHKPNHNKPLSTLPFVQRCTLTKLLSNDGNIELTH